MVYTTNYVRQRVSSNSKHESMGELSDCHFKFVGPKVIIVERTKGKGEEKGKEGA